MIGIFLISIWRKFIWKALLIAAWNFESSLEIARNAGLNIFAGIFSDPMENGLVNVPITATSLTASGRRRLSIG
jgi:hypothetical protein